MTEAERLKALEDAINSESDDVQLARRQEAREALEPVIRDHVAFLCRSRGAAVTRFVR